MDNAGFNMVGRLIYGFKSGTRRAIFQPEGISLIALIELLPRRRALVRGPPIPGWVV